MITIILTSYKEPKTIGKAIAKILKNKINDKFELLISAPDNETLKAAGKQAKDDKRVKILKDQGKGKPAALNMLFKKAKGKVIVLTDGDVFIADNSIQPLISQLKDKKIGAVTGRPVAQENKNTKYGYWANFLLDSAHEDRKKKSENNEFMLLSGYLFAMRNLNLQIPEDVLDDAYISQKIFEKGYRISYQPLSKVFIKNPSNFSDWVKQKRRNTSSDGKISVHIKKMQRSRSFLHEACQFYKPLIYSKNIKELYFSVQLIFARLLIWFLGFYDTKVVKKSTRKIWVRIESTK